MVRESYRNAPPKHKKLGWGTLGVLSWAPPPDADGLRRRVDEVANNAKVGTVKVQIA